MFYIQLSLKHKIYVQLCLLCM